MVDIDYYYDKNVFYIDLLVVRSLLSEFLVRDILRRFDLYIYMDIWIKWQKFIVCVVMIVFMIMFMVSVFLVMVFLIMFDKIDDLGE